MRNKRILRCCKWLVSGVLLAAQVAVSSHAGADEYPERPITLVIPFSAGGSHDLNARAFTSVISEYLGQPMVVQLTPGAGGQRGARAVAEAKPDGYTLLFGHNLIDQLQPHIEDLPYDPLTSFEAVWKLNDTVPVIYVNADSPFQGFDEVVSFGLDNPGELAYGHSGKWGFSFTVMSMLMSQTGVRFNTVPYQGGGPVKAAILAGDVDLSSAPYGSLRSLHEGGEIRVLAVAAGERLEALPDVPSFGELGYPYSGAVMERIVMAPAGTPVDRIRTLRSAFSKLYENDKFLKVMTQMEENTSFMDGAAYEKVRREQTETYELLVERIMEAGAE